jgi:enoyl-[acyl-carrier protein] reductase I
MPCDVEDDAQIDAVFDTLRRIWGGIDFVVHAVAFSDRGELKGRYVNTSRENFIHSLAISCYSFTAVAQRALKLMKPGGSLLTLTYLGSQRVTPNYNIMGVAKAGLEASVRYLAADLGRDGIRVNAVSAGPMRTLAGSVIGESRSVFRWSKHHSPLKKTIELEHVGNAALYLLSDMSSGVTGEIHFVDAGFNIVGMPSAAELAAYVAAGEGEESGEKVHAREHA